MFYGAYTDCYILYRATRYLMAFLGIFIFVGCVAVGPVFADLRNKKETAKKIQLFLVNFIVQGI